MSYTALARRYRSQSFVDVVGQEPIAQTLISAIQANRIHHAYLFTGTRGVGKTSMARIFARALNAPDTIDGCPHLPDTEYPPLDVQQRMAEAVMRGEDMNVIEIDGASNRGVEDARQLIANAGLAPSGQARFKVYIIDEVHMLTKDAFNTLLKIMEEPPSHLKFILATTEPHKVLPTIQSRCQRFDFRSIPTARIVEHLRHVLEQEKVGADDGVLYEIARLGHGSMRDALSLADRLLATGEDPITAELLQRMLGLPDRQLIFDLAAAVADADVAVALKKTDDLLQRGIAQDQLVISLIDHLRNLMLIRTCGADSDLVELDEAWRKQAAGQAESFDAPGLIHMMALLENVNMQSRSSATARAMLDVAVVRLALSEKFADLAALVAESPGERTSTRTSTATTAGQKKKPAAPIEVAASLAPKPPLVAAVPAPGPRSRSAAPTREPGKVSRPQVLSQDERDQILNQPLVREVVDLFDARLVDVRPAQKRGGRADPASPKES